MLQTDKDLIKKAVRNAHRRKGIVETSDFVAGAYYMLKQLSSAGVIKYEKTATSYVDIYKQLGKEADKEFKKETNEKEKTKTPQNRRSPKNG